ncbi:metal ABC transporter ATP-binding protein [Salisediminibacterium halotolerans]|uniref:metal ABC transporter ATP-binding protein n=1 Tax=Salisediminibacterium halotolerans TaxID=517425 RepID=UPI000EAF0D64|nr:metal ABC transporter ATP-binding protein [Salisediminibacterium halotolerans]RLJ78129.1 zinc transport system ATP-binding protein [Actinophytocola xinjiangensis]RPE88532.1 zinc transport system ATP-binding protein [Salisediminibacterium halotolerans]TWG37106.1 zinc transport system ATP-binding protein [Salisediminibacterium halotolerans]GEL08802.1 zinc ABC transporter ATP-binding protein [Salisediminibacterium halotolerans]
MANEKRSFAVEVTNVSFAYDQQNVLEDIQMNISKGSFLGLVGPNGSGKSTLIKLMLGLLKPDSGEIKLFGTDIKHFEQWNKIGFVSQKANSFNSGFPATVFEVVSMGLYGKVGLFRFLSKKDKQKVKETIAQVGMSEYEKTNIGNLSGGQQQRVFIARALVSSPDLLILDEPTVGVDQQSVANFYYMLEKLNRESGITLILVTHDVGAMTDYVTDVACLNKCLHFHGGSDDFAENKDSMMSKMYGHDVHLLEHNHDHHDHDHSHDHDHAGRSADD